MWRGSQGSVCALFGTIGCWLGLRLVLWCVLLLLLLLEWVWLLLLPLLLLLGLLPLGLLLDRFEAREVRVEGILRRL
jgi:hypothetical protein